jgi:hypothetical protein
LKMFVPLNVPPVARSPGMPKGFSSWLVTACTRGRFAVWSKQDGLTSGSGAFYAWSAATR